MPVDTIGELPSHPPVEAGPKPPPIPEANKEVSPRQKAITAILDGASLIKTNVQAPDSKIFLEQLDRNELNSDGLKAFFSSMDAIGDEKAKEIGGEAAKDMRVKVGDQMLTLEKWKVALAAVKNPDGSQTDAQKIQQQELENGVFAYSFPEAIEKSSENASIPKEKSAEDKIITDSIKTFEGKIKMAREQGASSEELEETLVLLRLAEKANGEGGVILKHEALRSLSADYKVQGIDNLINDLQEKVQPALDKVASLMEHNKAQEFLTAVGEGKLEDMISKGKLFKVEGMRELLFGESFTEKELKEAMTLDSKKKWKNSLLFALMVMMVGGVSVGQELIKTQ